MSDIKSPFWRIAAEYGIIIISIWTMVVGIYSFKFPNHFAFGGITGLSIVVSEISRWSVSDSAFTVNTSLLVSGFVFLGKGFRIKTAYVSMVMSINLSLLGRIYPLSRPLTTEPLLELLFAIFLPAVDTAILFSLDASSGGTNIIAMIFKKYTNLNIGTVLMLVDVAAVASSFSILGPEIELLSTIGLAARSLIIDGVIGNLSLCKCFSIIRDDPDLICDYIISMLYHSVTVYHAQGAFTHHEKTVTTTTMKHSQALELRNHIRTIEPTAFTLISNSSEVVGERFLAG